MPQETLKQRKQQLASALASGPRMHARSRGTFMRVHQDHEKAVFLSNRFDQKELAAAAAPAKMPGTLVGGGGVGERVLRCEGECEVGSPTRVEQLHASVGAERCGLLCGEQRVRFSHSAATSATSSAPKLQRSRQGACMVYACVSIAASPTCNSNYMPSIMNG